MAENITLTIDDQKVTVPRGTNILKAAQQLGIDVPHVCYHDALTPPAVCRMCVVEVEGARVLQAACIAKCGDEMIVNTRNDRIERARRTILEMLDSAVDLTEAPDIQMMLEEYEANPARFNDDTPRTFAIKDDNPFFIRDYNQCVMCWRCVQICADDGQFAFAINFGKRGFESHITTFDENPLPKTTCVFCGQCVGVCPTGALKPKIEWGLEQGMDFEEIRQMTRKGKKKKKDQREK